MADTTDIGPEHSSRPKEKRSSDTIKGCSDKPFAEWPARPGEEQHPWEEPRVVGNPQAIDAKRSNNKEHGIREPLEEDRGSGSDRGHIQNETQSELGGTIDGSSGGVDPITNRVDRLRLLGNGVVPQVAERAIRVLLNKLNAK